MKHRQRFTHLKQRAENLGWCLQQTRWKYYILETNSWPNEIECYDLDEVEYFIKDEEDARV